MNFKNFAHISEISETQISHLDNVFEFLSAAYLCGPQVAEMIDRLSDAEVSLLANLVVEDIKLLTEEDEEEGGKKKSKIHGRGGFGKVHHSEKKKRFMRPEEMGAATDDVTGEYSEFLKPRRFIYSAAKMLAAQTNSKWQDVIGQVDPKQVLELMKQDSTVQIPDDKKMLAQIKSVRDKVAKTEGGFANKLGGGFEERWPHILRNYLKEQEPIVHAVKELGTDASNEEIAAHLKAENIPILSGKLRKHFVLELARRMAQKVEAGKALLPQEQNAYRIWQQMSGGRPLRSYNVDHLFRYAEKSGQPLFDDDYVNHSMIDQIKDEVGRRLSYQEDPEVQDKSKQKMWQRQVDTWKKNQKTDPNALPYVVSDYHSSEATPNPDIIRKYYDSTGRHFNDYGYEQVVKAACVGTRSAVAAALMARNFPIYQLRLFDDRSMRGGLCGIQRKENDETMEKITAFLNGRTFDELVNEVILSQKDKNGVNGLLHSTNLPHWEDQEGIRVARARIVASRLINKIMRNKRTEYDMKSDMGHSAKSTMSQDATRGSRSQDEPASGGLFDPDTIRMVMQHPDIMVPRLQQVIANESDPQQKAQLQALLDQLMSKLQKQAV